jgi:hypothetical protein
VLSPLKHPISDGPAEQSHSNPYQSSIPSAPPSDGRLTENYVRRVSEPE